MKKYRVPVDCKEIILLPNNQIGYIKKALVEIKPGKWMVVHSWMSLKSDKNE